MTAPAPDQQLNAQVQAYQQASANLHAKVIAMVVAAWFGLQAWHDADLAAFLGRVLPIISGGTMTMANLTAAYIERLANSVVGGPQALHGVDVASAAAYTALRNGATPEEVYARPFRQLWLELSQGKPLAEAVRIRGSRLEMTIATDLQLAKTHVVRAVMGADTRIVGYRRVPNAGACPLCLLASTQRYHKGDLMPIHPNCRCDVVPIIGPHDPGQVIDQPLLDRLNAEKRQKTAVRHHGELGPLLVVAGQHFDGPSAVS